MLRRGLRRPFRLVEVRFYPSCLNVSTGIVDRGFLRARPHAHARMRTGVLRPEGLATLRQTGKPQVTGSFPVSRGRLFGRWPS